ncbi:PIN domain-containing protein [Microbacterium sp. P5_E9]
MSGSKVGVADTSVLVAQEVGRRLDESADIDRIVTTVVTLAELELGVLAAVDVETRARRLATLDRIADIEVLEATSEAAHEWARLRLFLREHDRRMEVNDLWIAAIAAANNLPVVTQDSDFDALDGAPGVAVMRV